MSDLDESKYERKRSRGIYILPNLFTTAALFCGFYAILAAIDSRFNVACVLVLVAMVFDAFDGRVARLTGTSSDFGVQYDSLSDLISFGLAPALLMYQWTLYLADTLPLVPSRLGWMAAFVYVCCAALRLARFNVQSAETDKAFFNGLPSPAAAGVIVGVVWWGNHYHWAPKNLFLFSALLLIVVGISMVCNIKFFSGKTMSFKKRMPFRYSAIPVLVLGLLFLDPVFFIPLLFFIYALHGPFWWLWRFYQLRWKKRHD